MIRPLKRARDMGLVLLNRVTLFERQLDAVDAALPTWKGTGRGRVETIKNLRERLAKHQKYKAFYWGCAGFPFVTADGPMPTGKYRKPGQGLRHYEELAREYQKGLKIRKLVEGQGKILHSGHMQVLLDCARHAIDGAPGHSADWVEEQLAE